MKQFIRTLLLSLLLTGVIGAAFWLFQQGTFFDPVVNRITMACLVPVSYTHLTLPTKA